MTARANRPAEAPLTPSELARLLRAFASMIERSVDAGIEPPRSAPRRSQRAREAPAIPLDDVTEQRIRDLFRRTGERP